MENKEQTTEEKIKELKLIQDDLTTSDLQGIAEAIEIGTGVSSELILQYCYDKISLSEVLK